MNLVYVLGSNPLSVIWVTNIFFSHDVYFNFAYGMVHE